MPSIVSHDFVRDKFGLSNFRFS